MTTGSSPTGGRRRSSLIVACACLALLTAATVTATAVAAATTRRTATVANVAVTINPPQPGTFTGKGFDACTAPSDAAMQAWLASPYRAVGIYFGGSNRGCAQPNLTSQWVTNQINRGWHLMPLYVGLQAPCYKSSKPKIDPLRAAEQGREQADDAVLQAQRLGLVKGSVLIYDMEAYEIGNAACTAAVNTFISAWTTRLHNYGYYSGFYSSVSSGVQDQVAVYGSRDHVRPDYIDFARWDNIPTIEDPAIPAGYWMPKGRMKQYRGDHNETWGGVTINIDSNYLDVAPMPTDGWSIVPDRRPSDGPASVYPGRRRPAP